MKKKKCYIYTRVSTAAQTEGYSLEAQVERLREYAEYRELEIVGLAFSLVVTIVSTSLSDWLLPF